MIALVKLSTRTPAGFTIRSSSCMVLEANNPIFDVPTTGTLVGDFLYFAANPQIDKRREDSSMPPPNELQDIQIVKLKL